MMQNHFCKISLDLDKTLTPKTLRGKLSVAKKQLQTWMSPRTSWYRNIYLYYIYSSAKRNHDRHGQSYKLVGKRANINTDTKLFIYKIKHRPSGWRNPPLQRTLPEPTSMPTRAPGHSRCTVCRLSRSTPPHCAVERKGFRLGILACSISHCSRCLLSMRHQLEWRWCLGFAFSLRSSWAPLPQHL